MKTSRLWRPVATILAAMLLLGLALPVGIPGVPTGAGVIAQGATALRLPLVSRSYLDPARRLSRFGISQVNLTDSPAAPLNDSLFGHHLNFVAQANPPTPGGIEYYQVIRLDQVGTSGYTSSPSGAALAAAVAANRGALWLIGNEPDRVQEDEVFQDDITPPVYARAYGDLYRQIKALDSTARIGAGNIVQPTPVRLRYLDMVLQSYRDQNGGAAMPVDVWSTHVYILPECPGTDWGAKMPPGVTDATDCTDYVPWDNADFNIFEAMVVRFRQWMTANGYRETPLYVTEFGVLMPWDMLLFWSGKPADAPAAKIEADARLIEFMDRSLNMMLNRTDAATGYPPDGNKLVQRWAWYSHSETDTYNGHLYDPVTKQRTAFGDHMAAAIAAQPRTVNLYGWRLQAQPASVASLGQLKEPVKLIATIVNNGTIDTRNAAAVRFYDGNPDTDGTLIGTAYAGPVAGGAGLVTVTLPWTPTASGSHQIYARVDPLNSIAETNEGDNHPAPITVAVNP